MKIQHVRYSFPRATFRTPFKFGKVVMKELILFNVSVDFEEKGKTATGTGSMVIGNGWSWPSSVYGLPETNDILSRLGIFYTEKVLSLTLDAHPLTLGHELEEQLPEWTREFEKKNDIKEEIPRLAQIMMASPLDIAFHNGYGLLHKKNVFELYSQEYMDYDLSYYLGDEFKGEYLDQYVLQKPKKSLPLYHLVGALDPLTPDDVQNKLDDGFPNDLIEWIAKDHLTHFKIKLIGEDKQWDSKRVLDIHAVCEKHMDQSRLGELNFSLDFNEKCENSAYLIDVLQAIKAGSQAAYDRIQYVEQPTSRFMQDVPEQRMFDAAALKPVVIDEGLLDVEAIKMSQKLGYSGVALKACKGYSQALLMGAYAQKHNLFLCVQDLTCPRESFLVSCSLSARIPGVAAIEGNARQFIPTFNDEYIKLYPEIFTYSDGRVHTDKLTKVGIGY